MPEQQPAPRPDFRPPQDFVVTRTHDGSGTLFSAQLDERYHSVHGAVAESMHVFIERGMRASAADPLRILEVGLGTGLNLLLTMIEGDASGRSMHYTALEPWPVSEELLHQLDHVAALGHPSFQEPFLRAMTAGDGKVVDLGARFRFQRRATPVQRFDERGTFDIIYFDAFGPPTQPEMWTAEVFARMHGALAPGGALVTYCAKGQVRRNMQAAGFHVERLPGPPGKREMLRATRPLT